LERKPSLKKLHCSICLKINASVIIYEKYMDVLDDPKVIDMFFAKKDKKGKVQLLETIHKMKVSSKGLFGNYSIL
jgi:hypothetical protein